MMGIYRLQEGDVFTQPEPEAVVAENNCDG